MQDSFEQRLHQSPVIYISGVKDLEPSKVGVRAHAYFVSKRIFDIVVCLFLIPVVIGVCLVLAVLNPIGNAGALFFVQNRMGKDGREFPMVKFRSMSPAKHVLRRAEDPLEKARLTPLGKWIRDYKVDELPQIFNVLLGHMSLVGPRPEMSTFVPTYRELIAGYDLRESFRPGMTGYAQVTQGYTDSIDMVRKKTELDLFYIRNAGWRLDLRIMFATMGIVIAPRTAPGAASCFAELRVAPAAEVESKGAASIGQPSRLAQ